MSIYPVQLSEWFDPRNDDEYNCFGTVYFLVKTIRCSACGSKVRWKKAVAHHSLPWGYGDLFCSWDCCYSGKEARPDKRRQRRINRQFKYL